MQIGATRIVRGRLLRGEVTLHSGNGATELGPRTHTPAGLRLGSVGIFLGGSNFAFERSGAAASFFRGRLDDVGIWGRALSAEEVAALFTRGASIGSR